MTTVMAISEHIARTMPKDLGRKMPKDLGRKMLVVLIAVWNRSEISRLPFVRL
jgi:hypothetical protein